MSLLARSHYAHKWFAGLFSLMAVLFVSLSAPSYADTIVPDLPKNAVRFDRLMGGQYVIDTMINGQGPFRVMVDTGASRTSIFESTARTLGLVTDENRQLNISGMVSSELRPVTTIKTLTFAGQKFGSREIVVLKDWPKLEGDTKTQAFDGIIGMDMLSGLIMQFYHDGRYVKVSSNGVLSKRKFRRWTKLKLTGNPYPVKDFGLIFTNTKFGDVKIPTLLDTGAGFTAMNWNIVKNTRIGGAKRRLREEWVVQGAVGDFKPRMRVVFDKLVIDGYVFRKHDLILMDFDQLPINNYGAYPLVICGIDIVGGEDFVLDLKNNNLYLKAKHRAYLPHGRMRARNVIDVMTVDNR